MLSNKFPRSGSLHDDSKVSEVLCTRHGVLRSERSLQKCGCQKFGTWKMGFLINTYTQLVVQVGKMRCMSVAVADAIWMRMSLKKLAHDPSAGSALSDSYWQ